MKHSFLDVVWEVSTLVYIIQRGLSHGEGDGDARVHV